MTGLHLSHYAIESELGRGGMGVVFLATDTKLNRKVALKVLPASALSSEDDRARFFREAQSAASISHPNACHVYQVDEAVPVEPGKDPQPGAEPRLFIAMEYIAGQTLHDYVKKGPLKLQEAVTIAGQIAEALKEAHAKDIVHRDIKSANVMLTSQGVAKVVDFGLAKTNQSTMLTRMGSTLGTVAYMSPEQARGEEVDGRSDLYSLGTVLYEMIAGRLPFAGDYEQAVLYGILNETPEPLTAVRTGVPMELERIANKLLSKEADYRYQTAADLTVDLKSLDLSGSGMTQRSMAAATGILGVPDRTVGLPIRGWRLPAIIAVALAVGWGVSTLFQGSGPVRQVEKLTLHIEGVRGIMSPALSPTKEYIAFAGADTTGWTGLFLYHVRTGVVSRIGRTEGGKHPWFSPSGDRLTYSRLGSQETLVVDIPAGAPRVVGPPGWFPYWEDKDHLLNTNMQASVARVDLTSGESSLLYEPDSTFGEYGVHPGPVVRGTRVQLANLQRVGTIDNDPHFLAIDLDSGKGTVGDPGIINPQGIGSGIVVYQLTDDLGPLVARRFDPGTRRFTSAPVPVVKTMQFAHFQATDGGDLLMTPRSAARTSQVLVVETRTAQVRRVSLEDSRDLQFFDPSISPDGQSVLLVARSNRLESSHIVRVELASGASAQHSPDMDIAAPLWTADNRAFVATVETGENEQVLIQYPVLGSGVPDTLSAPASRIVFGGESQRGAVVAFRRSEDADLRIGTLNPDSPSFRELPGQSGSNFAPAVSPDGRWVAYVNRTGTSSRIIAQDVISKAREEILVDAADVRWSPEGDYLYYLDDDELYRIPVTTRGGFTVRGQKEFVLRAAGNVFYSVGPDGRVVLLTTELSFSEKRENYDVIQWWRNYDLELERRLDGR
ncbi:MAG: Tol biopolymer transport system component/predicted Ser/Thr protein kinase [Rhodothermales bacterium]|jgi:Tol biopolymer transport system component/predicted Ser/Thr protein kinase